MSSVKSLKPAEIKQQISDLCDESEQIRIRGQEIARKIRELQLQCPHENTQKLSVDDVTETDSHPVCMDCGKIF